MQIGTSREAMYIRRRHTDRLANRQKSRQTGQVDSYTEREIGWQTDR